jgi:hypothetical protein
LPIDNLKSATFPYLLFAFAGLLLDVEADFLEAHAILITSVTFY